MSNLIGTFETNMSKSKKHTGSINKFTPIRLHEPLKKLIFQKYRLRLRRLLTVSVAIDSNQTRSTFNTPVAL